MGQSIETIGETKSGAAVDSAKVASKDTAAAPAKCPMMNDTSKVKGCYICPMHAEIIKKDAGECTKCGMELVFKPYTIDIAKSKGSGGCRKMNKQ